MMNLVLSNPEVTNSDNFISLHSLLSKNFGSLDLNQNIELSITLEEDTRLNILDDLFDFGFLNSSIKISLKKDSFLLYRILSKTSENKDIICEKRLHILCQEIGSDAKIQCAWMGQSKSNFKFISFQEHSAPKTSSDLVIKSVLLDDSRLFSENLIKIHKNAQGVKACEENKNLLLGSGARALSVPKLEVEANDVSCKHGSATSRISKDQLFFLQSKGIELEIAKNMLIDSFLKFS